MADLTQTPANVRVTSSTQLKRVTAGETVSPGMTAYRKAADGEYYKGIATSAATANVEGIFVGYADDGDDVYIATADNIDLGATLAVGSIYVVSNTAGAIMPSSDLSSGEFSTILGVATTTGNLKLAINVSGVAIP
jgi:hypothetical protein